MDNLVQTSRGKGAGGTLQKGTTGDGRRRSIAGFFERYAELTQEAANLDAFRTLGRDEGMTVIGPPLAQSHPMQQAATG